MPELDAQAVINKLLQRIADLELQNAVLKVKLDTPTHLDIPGQEPNEAEQG
jgi:hypothetical protein